MQNPMMFIFKSVYIRHKSIWQPYKYHFPQAIYTVAHLSWKKELIENEENMFWFSAIHSYSVYMV